MMDGRYAGEDVISGGSPATKFRDDLNRRIQYYLDKSTPLPTLRWFISLAMALLFALRIYAVHGFYIVTYGLGIYVLNLLIGFLSPQVDPEAEGPALPQKGSDEFKPFIRRLPEFKFWYNLTKAIGVAFLLTFLPFFDVPVFWPILLLYWVTLLVLTMKRQIRHMIKYKYVPFSWGKQKYKGGKKGGSSSESSGSGSVVGGPGIATGSSLPGSSSGGAEKKTRTAKD
eukprot:TRINITY_DN33301_c0_g1_i1.p1 TRINITY_DN33301_c0_g1~~TRINITY_DN33301_c0_g1_i1.p1  ORF type:complete len:227 (+),score=42.83 TRINITY_DN33301_c0_g1_i1:266-946(+)